MYICGSIWYLSKFPDLGEWTGLVKCLQESMLGLECLWERSVLVKSICGSGPD